MVSPCNRREPKAARRAGEPRTSEIGAIRTDRRSSLSLSLCALLLLAPQIACVEPAETGGITADVVFADMPGRLRQALRAAAPPEEVGKLQISALDASGSTLATTILSLTPGPGELELLPEGGDWVLDAVPAGPDRVILGKAFARLDLAPNDADTTIFAGRIEGVNVVAGQEQNVGALVLTPRDRVPEADLTAPGPPEGVTALPLPEGEALRVTFTAPPDPDVAGFVLAVATASAASERPQLERGRAIAEGDMLAPGVRVYRTWPLDNTEIVTVEGLVDNEPVGILVYAYDADRAGAPLNFSLPDSTNGMPADTAAPGAPGGLSARAVGPDRVQIEFVGPAEDGATGGAPGAYEVRVAEVRATLEDADGFGAAPAVEPPPVGAPGATVTFERTLAQLGAQPGVPFFLGVRAVDAAANLGAIGIAEVVLNTTIAPSLADIAPPIGLAGREIVLTGLGFGTVTGTVTLTPSETGTVTVGLNVSRWTNDQIVAALPVQARTGRLAIVRPDGQRIDAPLSVVARIPDQVQDQEFPFEAIGTDGDAPAIYALYREDGEFRPYDGAIERFYDATAETTPWAPSIEQARSTAIAGVYSPRLDRFLFVASNDPLSMTTALVTSSTITPDPFRLGIGVTAGRADRVSVVITPGGVGGEVPAMIAFTIDGTIRTATVTDARFQPFDGFFATSSTTALYERVTLAQKDDDALLMAHRTITGTVAVLSLRDNAGGVDPNAFTPRVLQSPPRVGSNFEILAAPLTPGGAQRFLIAYEHLQPNLDTQVRLVWADDAGTRLGLAPLGPGDRRLDDVGLVVREGEVYVALVSSRVEGSAELTYTEVPISAISDPAAADGGWPGVVMDIAPSDHVARLACKPFLRATCPIFWLGDGEGVLFLRR